MANADKPSGFSPTPLLHLAPYDVAAANTATAIFINDPVLVGASGYLTQATAGSALMMGVSQSYLAKSTAGTIMVADDPHQLYHAQDNAGGTPAISNIGQYTDHVAGTGSAVTKLSGAELNSAAYGTTVTGWLILDLVDRPDNSWGIHADQVCRIYDHIFGKTGVA